MLATIQPIPADSARRESRQALPVPSRRGVVAPSPFCDYLQERGGVHLWFAEFLRWRADLLRASTLLALQALPSPSWTIERGDAIAIIEADLGDTAPELAGSLSPAPCWSSGFSCAYRARSSGRDVVVQFSRQPLEAAAFTAFERSLAVWKDDETLEEPPGAKAFVQFREWMRAGLSPAAGRRLLEAVQEFGGHTVTRFPAPIEGLCSDRVLGYEWLEGQPLAPLVMSGALEPFQKWCETLLEQICLFSVVDADASLDNLVLTPSGAVGLRFPPRFVAIPAVQVRRTLKYVSSVFAGNVPAAAHSLLKLSGSEAGDDGHMLDALAAVEPDLKVNLAFPPSAGQFENQWRALAVLRPARPLFVDCFHRNLIGAGYVAAQRGATGDPLEMAHWPVLGRLLRTRIGELLTRENASDWLMGSGLLVVEAMRQMGRLAEDFRDDDVSLRVNVAHASGGGGEHSAHRSANHAAAMLIAGGMLLAVLLLCLRWGFELPGPWPAVAAAGGVLAALGLFLVVSHIE